MPNLAFLTSAIAGAGRFTPVAPTLSYAGSGTTNNGKFTITNYDPTFIYTASGGTVTDNIFYVTATTGSGTLTAKSPKGQTSSPYVVAYRQAATLVNVPFVQCYDPCGNCSDSGGYWHWDCGCGSPCGDSGGGAWGECICRGPGYNYYQNYGPSYTWSGSDYTNGAGEWWKIG